MEANAETMKKKFQDKKKIRGPLICNIAQYFYLGMPFILSFINLANHIYLMLQCLMKET